MIAVKSLDLSGVKVSEDGTVDSAAIKALIADLQRRLNGEPVTTVFLEATG